VCRSVGSCFLSRKAYNAGSGKQTGTPKRSRLLQETALCWPPNRARQPPGPGEFVALDGGNYSVKPQYANPLLEVPYIISLDDRRRFLLAIRAVPSREVLWSRISRRKNVPSGWPAVYHGP
jgi:hypothetical protein